jgi:hypothetical protein
MAQGGQQPCIKSGWTRQKRKAQRLKNSQRGRNETSTASKDIIRLGLHAGNGGCTCGTSQKGGSPLSNHIAKSGYSDCEDMQVYDGV